MYVRGFNIRTLKWLNLTCAVSIFHKSYFHVQKWFWWLGHSRVTRTYGFTALMTFVGDVPNRYVADKSWEYCSQTDQNISGVGKSSRALSIFSNFCFIFRLGEYILCLSKHVVRKTLFRNSCGLWDTCGRKGLKTEHGSWNGKIPPWISLFSIGLSINSRLVC